jgi:phosphoglucosamine mutase
VLRFGTDGVRGDAEADLTDDLIRALGQAAARVLGADRFVVGRDTRESGPRIEDALLEGLSDAGAQATSLGVMPTPGVAYFAQHDNAAAAVISASHNAWSDNGVKLLAVGGRKLPDDVEAAIERQLEETRADSTAERFVAWTQAEHRGVEYVEHLVAALEGRTLDGMRVVVDCANGAAHQVGPAAFRASSADVVVLNADPNGRNINANCGSTSPDRLRAAVREHRADIGLALDGDADRVIAADERGELVDGDQIMTALAIDLHARGNLRNDAIAVTVMSNLGLRKALAAAGIAVVETPVGDRNVLAALEEHDLVLGGEQSGHVILRDLATTGDGVLTGLVICDLMRRTGAPLSRVAAQMERFPQVLVNVPVARRPDLDRAGDLRAVIATLEAALADRGRVLVRASGTEPVVRVMVEAPTEDEARAAVSTLREAVETAFTR